MIRSSKLLVLVAATATVMAGMALAPAEASAQRRPVTRPPATRAVVAVPRPPTRTVVVVAARPHRPFFVAPFPFGAYGAFAGWHRGWYGWPSYYAQPYPPYYPHPRFYADYSSAARIRVQPSHAEVFIDGHFVGTVDNFDGWAQRLRVAPGERELVIFLEGYQTYRRDVLFRPGATITIQHELQPLGPDDPPTTRPDPAPAAAPQPSVRRPAYPPGRGPGAASPVPDREARAYGAVEIRVQPADAEVLVNGERWETSEPGSVTVEVSDGTHRVEIRREGFRTYSADVRVVGGQVTTVNVSLSPE